MSETKTYIVGEGENGSNMLSAIAPLLQQRGVDPNVLAMMNNGGGFGGNNFIWAIFLLALFGWGGNGFGGWGNNGGVNGGAGFLANQISNNEGRDLLMQAIQGNRDSIANLAATLGTDFTQVSNALNAVNTQLCSIGKDVGMTGMQVVNAIQQGNMTLAQQLSNGFSQINLSMCQQTNALQNAICDAKGDIKNGMTMLGFQSERQTTALTEAISRSTQTIVDGQKQAEIRELQGIINAQNTQISELKAAASTRQIVDVALAPVLAQLATLTAGGGAAAKVAGA